MKKSIYSILTALIVLVSINTSKAQVSFSVHIGTASLGATGLRAYGSVLLHPRDGLLL